MATGRKVYRNSTGARKQRRKTAMIILIAVLGLSALGFIAYSVAEPVSRFFREWGTGSVTEPWNRPSLPDELTADNNPPDSSDDEDEENAGNKPTFRFSACTIPISAMTNSETLKDALVRAKSDGYSAAVVTMKAKGGTIFYATKSDMAYTDENAVKGELTAEHTAALITAAGLKPIAYVNVLEDHNKYGASRKGAYRFASDNSTWYDNKVENGGKVWLSPFDPDTADYASFLANEITVAGFETVIFDGIIFPPFRNSDLNYIGDIVKSENRYNALTDVAVTLSTVAASNGASAMIQVPAADILLDAAEVFKPDIFREMMPGAALLVGYTPSDISKTIVVDNQEVVLTDMSLHDRTAVVFSLISRKAGSDIPIVPYINTTDLSQSDFDEVITALLSSGYDSYVIGT